MAEHKLVKQFYPSNQKNPINIKPGRKKKIQIKSLETVSEKVKINHFNICIPPHLKKKTPKEPKSNLYILSSHFIPCIQVSHNCHLCHRSTYSFPGKFLAYQKGMK